MLWIIIGAIAYLMIGCLLAYGFDGSIDLHIPRWLQIPVVILFWPVVVVGLLIAFMGWIAGGSH